MNYFEAHKILDGIKDNLSYNLDIINQALELTGDLDGFQPSIRAASRTFDKAGLDEGLEAVCKASG